MNGLTIVKEELQDPSYELQNFEHVLVKQEENYHELSTVKVEDNEEHKEYFINSFESHDKRDRSFTQKSPLQTDIANSFNQSVQHSVELSQSSDLQNEAPTQKEPICQHCGKSVLHIRSLKLHMGKQSKSQKSKHMAAKPQKCEHCGNTFPNKRTMNLHKLAYTIKEEPNNYKECTTVLVQQHLLLQHKQTHHKKKPVLCGYCGIIFSSRKYLKRHQIMHSEEKPYGCEQCGKCFVHNNTLEVHRQIHSAVKTNNCKDCGKSFSYRSNLKQHQAMHVREKIFKCSLQTSKESLE